VGTTTAIKWTDHTFNPWMGCTKVSPGCDHCYAEALGKRTGRVQWGDDAERVVTSDAYWKNPLKWNRQAEAEGRRHRVFCASMADVFERRADVLDARGALFNLIDETPWLDWQLLTKRPENVRGMVPYDWTCHDDCWPANAWIGTTVEDQQRADERIPHLLDIPARVRFLSCEPLLGEVRLSRWLFDGPERTDAIHWVIVGGESGAGHRPLDLRHARILQRSCANASVPFFFKQVGGRTPTAGGDLLDGVAYKEFPA
jgi:protein gp37